MMKPWTSLTEAMNEFWIDFPGTDLKKYTESRMDDARFTPEFMIKFVDLNENKWTQIEASKKNMEDIYKKERKKLEKKLKKEVGRTRKEEEEKKRKEKEEEEKKMKEKEEEEKKTKEKEEEEEEDNPTAVNIKNLKEKLGSLSMEYAALVQQERETFNKAEAERKAGAFYQNLKNRFPNTKPMKK